MKTTSIVLLFILLWTGCTFNPPAYTPNDDKDMKKYATDMLFPPRDSSGDGPGDMTLDQTRDQSRDLTRDATNDLPKTDMPVEMSDMPVDTPPDMPQTLFAMCDGSRVDLYSDATNCGQCGVKCDGKFGVCNRGVCGCDNSDMLACGDNRRCEDVKIDPKNCGQCDFACGAGAACVNGACKCRVGFTECNGECVDTTVDPRHCGECNKNCGGNACRRSSCRDKRECDFLEGSCGRGDAGLACLSTQGMENDLYCRNGAEFGCGDQCGGNQYCDKLDLLLPRKCYSFRPGRGCSECPCDDCSNNEVCRDAIGVTRKVYCVRK